MNIPVDVLRLPHAEGLPLPSYGHPGDACFDLAAAVTEPICLNPHCRATIPTGLRVGLPVGFELVIRSRSGLSSRKGVVVANSPATIDESYRGEIMVILMNTDPWDSFHVERGMRIAQATIAPTYRVSWVERDSLDETARGGDGLGSTGLASSR